MINRRILIIIYISLITFITMIFVLLSVLGNKSRYGYLSDFVMRESSIDETLRMNGIYDMKTNFQKILTNDKGKIETVTDNEAIIKFIFTNENVTNYHYGITLRYYSKIFKHSDIYGVYLNKDLITNSYSFIKDVNMVYGGSPFGNIVSTKKIDSDKIENIKYTLKIKYKFYFTILFITTYIFVLLYIFSYAVLSLNIKHLKLFIPLIIIFSLIILLLNLKLNYFGIILLIIMIVIFYNREISCEIFFNKKLKLFILISTSLFFGILYIFISIHTPYSVGHDFSLIIPRAYSLLLYAKNNGIFSTEFASPLFGAGLISYANPQYDQFSILYFFRHFMPFWNAYLICTFLFTVLGFISFYYAVKDILKCSFEISIMSAILFSCTGYYMHHILVGHWAFLYHPFTIVIVWMSFTDRFNYITRILISAISFSIMIFGGAMQTIFFLTCFSLLGVASILFKPNKKFFLQCLSIVLSCFLGIILSISKFIPSVYFGSSIERGIMLNSNDIFILIRNILYIILYPFYNLIFLNLDVNNDNIIAMLKLNIGYLWENDLAFPVSVFIAALFIIIYSIKTKNKSEIINFILKNKIKIFLLLIFTYLYCDIFFANGIIRTFFKKLREVNIHLRMASVWITPLLFIFALLLNKVNFKRSYKNIIIIFISFLSIFLFTYKFLYLKYNNYAYTGLYIGFDNEIFESIKYNHDKYKVNYINNNKEFYNLNDFLNEEGTFKLNSSRLPYEPIYGYGLHSFKPKEEGSPYKIVNGKYNFTDPRSLIFFNDEYSQFSGFSTNDKNTLDNFLSFKSVDWEIPKIFIISNYISIISHIIVFLFLIFNILFYLFRMKKDRICIINN